MTHYQHDSPDYQNDDDKKEPFLSPKLKMLINRPSTRDILALATADPENAEYWMFYESQRHMLWRCYQTAEAAFWRANEMNWNKDELDFRLRLSEAERHIVRTILAFFATGDGVVGENLEERFSHAITSSEAKHFYITQEHMEKIHGQVYLDALKAFVPDEDEQQHLIDAFHNLDVVRAKTQFALRYTADPAIPFRQLNFVYAIVEGVFFSSSFLFIAWFKKDGRMPMFGTANEAIQRDEGMHRDFGVEIQHSLKYPMEESAAIPIMREAVELSSAFVRECLPKPIREMSAEMVIMHVKAVADKLMMDFGFNPLYGGKPTPFNWFVEQRLQPATAFFERQGMEYRKDGEFAGEGGILLCGNDEIF